MRFSALLLFVWLNLTPGLGLAASLNTLCLDTQLAILTSRAGGRIGICISDGHKAVSYNGGKQFSLYNVVGLPVAVAVLDAVDKGRIHLEDVVTGQPEVHRAGGQLPSKPAGANGPKATTRDLLVRMVADNDSTATDSLIARLGGPRVVQNVLAQKGIRGFRINRTERDAGSLAYEHHNSATPIAVANLLQWLVNGTLLSSRSSTLLLETMGTARASLDRLKAGLPTGWLIAHVSSSSTSSMVVSGAANDVGILMAPDARNFVVVAVLISNPGKSGQDRATFIADVARAVGTCFR